MSTLHNFEEMAGVAFPADGTGEYNRLLRDCYFTKHADFAVEDSESFGKWKCNVCLQGVFIQQKPGTGLSSLVRHVKSKHTEHRIVRKSHYKTYCKRDFVIKGIMVRYAKLLVMVQGLLIHILHRKFLRRQRTSIAGLNSA